MKRNMNRRNRFVSEVLGLGAAADAAQQAGQAATQQINQVGNAATQAANQANSTFQIAGQQLNQVGPAVSNAAGSIATAGNQVDKSLKILTPIVAVAGATFGAVQLGKLMKSIKGNRATSDVQLDFTNRQLADQFAGKLATYKDLKPYCKIKSIQSNKVVLSVDTDYLQRHYNEFNKKVGELMTTNKKRTVNENSALWLALGTGALSTLGALAINPIVNAVQGKSGVLTTVTYQFRDSKSMNQFVQLMKMPKMAKASVKVVDENNAMKTVTITADEKKVKKVFPEIEKYATMSGADGGSGTVNEQINENTKITLTIGQIKRLIRESSHNGCAY